MWVVKIGGSLEGCAGLGALLALLADHGRAGIIIVPGGGRFADRVRAGQRATAMDDATAHRLAIRAMEQYAAVLCRMEPRLYPVTGVDGICDAGGSSTAPVWLPGKQLAGQPGIPANWQVTSDSLALWFAAQVHADALVLVKSARRQTNDARKLAASGYLDEYFPEMMKKTGFDAIAGVSVNDPEVLRQTLVSGAIPAAIRITCASQERGTESTPSPTRGGIKKPGA